MKILGTRLRLLQHLFLHRVENAVAPSLGRASPKTSASPLA